MVMPQLAKVTIGLFTAEASFLVVPAQLQDVTNGANKSVVSGRG